MLLTFPPVVQPLLGPGRWYRPGTVPGSPDWWAARYAGSDHLPM